MGILLQMFLASDKTGLQYPIGYSVDDCECMYHIVEAEVTDGTWEQKMDVAIVILNRLHGGWGDTIEEVVYQKGQFSPVQDGKIRGPKPTIQTIQVCNMVMTYWKVLREDGMEKALYFKNSKKSKADWSDKPWYKYDGAHDFYGEEGT